MKYKKRKNIYEASNVTFNRENCAAFSYQWWKFVGIVEGKVVFNNFYYSPTTRQHQYKVRKLLNELNIKIDLELPIPRGLPGSWRKSYAMGTQVTESNAILADLYLIAEEYLCDKFLTEEIKREEKNERLRLKRQARVTLLKQAYQQTTDRGFQYDAIPF
jgi:hypothetical protein